VGDDAVDWMGHLPTMPGRFAPKLYAWSCSEEGSCRPSCCALSMMTSQPPGAADSTQLTQSRRRRFAPCLPVAKQRNAISGAPRRAN